MINPRFVECNIFCADGNKNLLFVSREVGDVTLGKRLVICREQRRLRQQDVAERLGLTNTQLSNYERDYREPNLATLVKLARFYRVSVQWLATGEETDLGELLEKRGIRFYGVEVPDEVRLEIKALLEQKLRRP
jgi:transcriptional regulator with XRE-family HTH domain